MFELIKKRYRQIKKGNPGSRFRDFYHLRHEKTEGSNWYNKAYTFVGITLLAGGFLLSIPPGVPGFIAIIAGTSMVVARSYSLATFLDALETSVRCVLYKKCPEES